MSATNPETDSDSQRGDLEVHLHVLLHGLWGNPSHLLEAIRVFKDRRLSDAANELENPCHVELLLSESNGSGGHTHDGIDWCGERVVEEIFARVREIEKDGKRVSRFSITGYSLGGLVARYIVGILHHRGFFEAVAPVNFATIATPHIGVPRYPNFFSSMNSWIGPRFLGRTGKQFYLKDTWSKSGKPLLEVMADPDLIFHKALSLFPHINIFANAVNDMTVPYVTGAFELTDSFLGQKNIVPEYIPGYEPVIESFLISTPPSPSKSRSNHRPSLKMRLESFKPLPFNGPFREWTFPASITLYILLPLLLPLILMIALTQFTFWSRSSEERIRLLQSSPSSNRLINALANFEKDIEQAVGSAGMGVDRSPHDSHVTSYPELSPSQQRIVASLNAISQVRKHIVYIDGVRNSHALIICRNPLVDSKRRGEGALKFWADIFII